MDEARDEGSLGRGLTRGVRGWWRARTRLHADAARLAARTAEAGRAPSLFGPNRTPDTLDGRFEMAVLHAVLALRRLQREPRLAPLAQAFSDRFFRNLDAGLREAGVGDLTVPKTIKKLARAFYGRLGAYDSALKGGDEVALAEALARNVWNGAGHPFALPLARRALALDAALAAAPIEALFETPIWAAGEDGKSP